MDIKIIGKDFKVTEGINSYVEKKLTRIEKYFTEAKYTVTLKAIKNIQIAEISISTPEAHFRAEVEDKDLYAAIDKDIDILEGQIRKYKTKRDKINKDQTLKMVENQEDILEPENEILKSAYYEIKPLTLEDAKLKLEDMPSHSFLVFLNGETSKVNVLYRLKDGKNYGLVEPEA